MDTDAFASFTEYKDLLNEIEDEIPKKGDSKRQASLRETMKGFSSPVMFGIVSLAILRFNVRKLLDQGHTESLLRTAHEDHLSRDDGPGR